MNEKPKTASYYKTISGLGEALFKGDTQKLRELLSGVSTGEVVRTWGLELQVDSPTPEEMELMRKSKEEKIEYGLFQAGDTHMKIKGKAREIDDQECLKIASELAKIPGPKSFSHTHWNNEYTPIPSGPDVTMFRILSMSHLGYRFRVISWLPNSKVFELVGEYKV